MGRIVTVRELPRCDFCAIEGTDVAAEYDFRTKHGPWANGCERHWRVNRASSQLGTGHGQLLAIEVPMTADPTVVANRTPTASELQIAFMEAETEGVCDALDGCRVEPDGTCPHGHPSILRAAGVV